MHSSSDFVVVDTKSVQALDSAHYLHAFTDTKALAAMGARVIVKGEGIYIWDSEGKKILDGMSGLWCVNVGYGRKEISAAVVAQMDTLPYYNSFFNTTNLPAVNLAKATATAAMVPVWITVNTVQPYRKAGNWP